MALQIFQLLILRCKLKDTMQHLHAAITWAFGVSHDDPDIRIIVELFFMSDILSLG
jgi:hypothetical protein